MTQHRVLVVDTKTNNPNRYSAIGLKYGFAAHPDVAQAELATYRDAFAVAEALRPTLLCVFDGEEIDPFVLSRLVDMVDVSTIWFTEDPYEQAHNLQNEKLVDFVFSNDKKSVGNYKNGHYLPLAAFEPFHRRPIEESKLRYDLFFCGTAWPNRIKMFRSFMKLDKSLRIKLFAPPTPLGGFEGKIGPEASIMPFATSAMDFARFIAASVATLYVTRDYSSTGGGAPTMTTSPGTRFFETAVAGGVQVYPAGTIDPPEDFVDGENIFSFRSIEELVGIVARLRDDPALRTAAARRCQQIGLARHTFAHRAARIMEVMQ